MPQMVMPLFPHGTTHINNLLAFSCEEGTVTYFNASMPLFSHRETDVASFHMIIAQFYLNGHVKQTAICRAFGVTAISVKRAVKLHCEQGVKGFFVPRKGRGPAVLTRFVSQISLKPSPGKGFSDFFFSNVAIRIVFIALHIGLLCLICSHGRSPPPPRNPDPSRKTVRSDPVDLP